MEIVITKRQTSRANKYGIYCDGKLVRYAQSRPVGFLNNIDIVNVEGGHSLFKLVERPSFLSTSYDIVYQEGTTAKFRTRSCWKNHYFCQHGQDAYEVYSHKSLRYSIYKNGSQTASWEWDSVPGRACGGYRMQTDDIGAIDLLVSFCLILDDSSSNHLQSNANSGNFRLLDTGLNLNGQSSNRTCPE
jgi:hypothetical protein